MMELLLFLQVVLDGELLGTTPVQARVLPGSLKVLVPSPALEVAEQVAKEAGIPKAAALQLVLEEFADDTASSGEAVVAKQSANVENMPVVSPVPNGGGTNTNVDDE